MNNNNNIEILMEEVNPVYMTAQRCLQIIAELGDDDSRQLCRVLGLPTLEESFKGSDRLPEHVAEALKLTMPVFNAIPEARFIASTNLILSSAAKQVVDLPCGYTSRGIKLQKSNIRYFGFDLPAVTSVVGNAVKEIIGENNSIKYCPVDATNYNSLRQALGDIRGELYITTEGMLMYFTQNELETVFGNIRRLLSEFGGKWITMDSELDTAQKKIMSIITGSLPKDRAEQVRSIVSEYAGKVSKTTLLNNRFYDPDQKKVKQFVSDMGFDLEMIPMKQYMPKSVYSLNELSADARQKALEVLGEVNFWVMTAKQKTREESAHNDNKFSAHARMSGDTLNITVCGRLDTITAPELLSLYKESAARSKITAICVDMNGLEYISSAGLRVLLIMRKSVDDGAGFSLINMNKAVRDIMETTGFDTIMC